MQNKPLFKSHILSDVVLNVCAVFISTAALQLVALPMLSKKMTPDDYGTLLAMVSMFYLVSGTFANALNNVRLLNRKEGVDAICNFLVIVFLPVVVMITIVYCVSNGIQDSLTVVFAVITASIIFCGDYFSVYYRLTLNYRIVLISSVITAVLYLIGAFLGGRYQVWLLPYALARGISTLIAFLYGKPWQKGIMCKSENIPIIKETAVLVGAKFLGRIMTYADKIVLYGLLGGTSVSVYYVAGLLGKCLSMVISPLNNVVLSHLCSEEKKTRMFDYTFFAGAIVCLLFYGITFLVEKPFLDLLYPDFAEEAMNYIAVTNASALIMTLVSMLEPFVLRYCHINFQLLLNGSVSVVYLILAVGLGSYLGLMGFCVACLISYVFKLLIVVCIYKNSEQKEKGIKIHERTL